MLPNHVKVLIGLPLSSINVKTEHFNLKTSDNLKCWVTQIKLDLYE